MKIALITGFFDEKFYYREHAYAEFFVKNNIDYLIISSNLSLPQKNTKVKPTDTGKFNILRGSSIFSVKDFVILNYKKELEKFSPDVIHIFDAQQGVSIPAVLWAKKRRIPIVYDHELQRIPKSYFGKLRFNLITKPITKFILSNSDQIRVVTPAAFKLLTSIAKFDHQKVNIGHLGYSDNFSTDSNLPFKLNYEFEYIMTSGYFDKFKNIQSIVSAFLLFWRNNNNSRLIIIGPIENVKVQNIVKKHSCILHYNQFLNLEQLNYLYSKIKIHIWPKSTASIFETLKFNNYIILNKNDDTSHLTSSQIILLDNFNAFAISSQFKKLINKSLESDNDEYSYDRILNKLITTYKYLINR